MYGFIGKIWKDPVWSKVIAAGVLGAIAFIYEAITKKSLFGWVTNLIPVWWLLLIIFIILVFVWIRNRWIATAGNESNSKDSVYIDKIKEFNRLTIGTVQWRWVVKVSDKNVWPINFTAYCMKHDEIGSLFVPNERLGDRLMCLRCNSYIPTEHELMFNLDSNKEGQELSMPDAIQRIRVEFDKNLQLVNKEFQQSQ